MKTYGKWICTGVFLTSALVESEWSAPRLTIGEKSPRYPTDRRLGEPQSRSGWYAKVNILDPTGTRTKKFILSLRNIWRFFFINTKANPCDTIMTLKQIKKITHWMCNLYLFFPASQSRPRSNIQQRPLYEPLGYRLYMWWEGLILSCTSFCHPTGRGYKSAYRHHSDLSDKTRKTGT
jgi:hypothetical protein